MGFNLPNGADISEEQLDIINLPTTKDWVIKGAPGTGKTVMAIYRAGQASQTSKGKPVLMLVYNNPLMNFLSTAVQGNYFKNVKIATYHRWLNDMYQEENWGAVPKVNKDDFLWDAIARRMATIGKKYSHIIIDEAQDFPIELLQILKRISDHMTCFIDPNQVIKTGNTDTCEAIKTLCVEAPYTLTRNFRNTKPIRDLSALYCLNGKPAPSDIPGKKPAIIKCSGGYDDQNAKMSKIINRNKEKSIGIIVNPSALNSTFNAMQNSLSDDVKVQMHKPQTHHRIDFDQPGVKILSYGTMKGLEFDVVLLPNFDQIKTQDDEVVDANRVYVAMSRSVSELYLFYWNERPSYNKIDTMTALTAHRDLLEWK